MRIFFDITIFTAIGLAVLFVYLEFWDDIRLAVFNEEATYSLFVDTVPLDVTVADDPATRTKGLSGVSRLEPNQGKLFVFDDESKHGIWMKDMLIPLDIIWIDNELKIVYIEKQATPDSFPTVFAPTEPARFVIEVNAFFVDSHNLEIGDTVFIPPEILPADIIKDLQE
ncbi:DUF192 domain-containing protein [Candidatus Kaiserbacteria bacterium]|nr:DUF192 domain-containing protein [Candidatus Kaiserbacteria bacterium]